MGALGYEPGVSFVGPLPGFLIGELCQVAVFGQPSSGLGPAPARPLR